EGRLPACSGSRAVVAVVDATASMSLVEGGQTRFARACREADEMLARLGGSDVANVVWLDTEPRAVYPDGPGENITYLREELRRARSGWGRGSPERTLRFALDQFESAAGE